MMIVFYLCHIKKNIEIVCYIEKWGSCVASIIEVCKQHDIPEPTYEDKGGFIHIVFKRKSYKVIDEPQNEPQNTPLKILSERQRKIVNAIKSNPNITKKEIAMVFFISESTVAREIKNIREHITINWKGSSKGGHWEFE